MALQAYYSAYSLPPHKHRAQFERLEEHRQELCKGCDSEYVKNVIAEAVRAMRNERLSCYDRLKVLVAKSIGSKAMETAMSGPAGKIVRRIRHTEPEPIRGLPPEFEF